MLSHRSPAIELSQLTKTFGHLFALQPLDLSVDSGQFVTIFGPNGAGKTTMIRILSTLAKATSGEVRVLGTDVKENPDRIRRSIGVIGHQTFLYEELSAEENLRFYGRLYDVPDLEQKIKTNLAEVGLTHRSKDKTATFSRGMQQRLAIARAILHEPAVLLLDEPYTGLDQHAAQVLTRWLTKLRADSHTTLMVTHNIERGLQLADRVLILKNGRIVFDKIAQGLDVKEFKSIYANRIDRGTAMSSKIGTLLWKDLISELRSKETVFSMLIFSLMMAVVFNFSFPPGSEFIEQASPGILWMTFIFASLLGIGRSFVREVDKGCLMGLMLAPIDRAIIYISKAIINFLFITLVELLTLPLFTIFFKLDLISNLGSIIFVFAISTFGFAVVGTLFSAISVNLKTREVMLPILHFPVSIPLIICGVQATRAAMEGQDWSTIWSWCKIIIAFDIIFLIVGYLTFEYIIEE